MCDHCGCSLNSKDLIVSSGTAKIQVTELATRLLRANDHEALHNREHFDRHHVLAMNLMSSPGSGKTSLLEATIEALRDEVRMAVIEGDLETENDADRMRAKGVPTVQITTGTTAPISEISVRSHPGIDSWLRWIREKLDGNRKHKLKVHL